MRGGFERSYNYRTEESRAEEYAMEQGNGGGRVQLIVALLGIFSLVFMLWTIAKMLGVLEG